MRRECRSLSRADGAVRLDLRTVTCGLARPSGRRDLHPCVRDVATVLGSNSDPDTDPDNCQRYDDHQHVNRQPCGYAFRPLGHSVCPPRSRYVPEERKWL